MPINTCRRTDADVKQKIESGTSTQFQIGNIVLYLATGC